MKHEIYSTTLEVAIAEMPTTAERLGQAKSYQEFIMELAHYLVRTSLYDGMLYMDFNEQGQLSTSYIHCPNDFIEDYFCYIPQEDRVVESLGLQDQRTQRQGCYSIDRVNPDFVRKVSGHLLHHGQQWWVMPVYDRQQILLSVVVILKKASPLNGRSVDESKLFTLLSQFVSGWVENYHAHQNLKDLFESVVLALATAIDEKSPYTGDHSRRVPEVAKLLARALSDVNYGPFKDLKMSAHEMYELELAALLHDCGKVTTPVHVMDKSTKLEAIFDRIHLVDLRFEVIIKERERERAQLTKMKNVVDRNEKKALIAEEIEQMKADREFLHLCNVGREFMDPQMRERVRQISEKYYWTDSEGNHHRVVNDSEMNNLLVVRGTLNEEERKIIERHAEMTISMLNKIKFPHSLRNIPEIAVNHHEKMDGSGYPRGLRREQMSIKARLMGVADVFEALTAKDRPYKKGKTLSEVMQIMVRMVQDQHIDPDIFYVFVKERVYLQYAQKYLDSWQIDEVNESNLLESARPKEKKAA